MDFTDILPILIFLAFYIIAARKNKKNRNEKIAQTGKAAPSRPAAGGGLQERLEEALRQMQERVEQETGARTPVAAPARMQPSSSPAPVAVAEMLSAPIESFESDAFESSSGNSPFAFTSATPLHQRKTVLDAFRKDTPAKRSREETFQEGFGAFHQGHGLHSKSEDDGKVPEFHEAHGLHPDKATFQWGEKLKPMSDAPSTFLFRNPEDLRRAIIAAEILGPPKGAGRR